MMFGFWELVIIAVIFGVPLLIGVLIVWLVVCALSKRKSLRISSPGQGKGTAHRDQR